MATQWCKNQRYLKDYNLTDISVWAGSLFQQSTHMNLHRRVPKETLYDGI